MTSPLEAVSPAAQPERGGLREVGQLAYPVIGSQIAATVMGVVDSAMVGRIGATELGAVGFAGIWNWTFFCLFFGTASAVQTFVSQADGAGHPERCGRWGWLGLVVVVPASVLAAIALYALAPVALAAMGPSEELQTAALSYLRPRLFGVAGIAIAFVWMSFFRGIGDTRTPLWAAILANGVNIVLDYGLIFGELGLPKMGVAGAGTATAIGEWIYGGFLVVAALRPAVAQRFQIRVAPISLPDVRRFLRVGLPIGGQWVIDMAAFAVFSTVVARMGDVSMAASQAFVSLLSISFMQAVGISVAASTLVGRYIGADDPEAAERSFASGLRFAAVLAGAVALLFWFGAESLVGLFSTDPEVIALGAPLVRMGAFFQLLDAVAIVSGGALRGAGDTSWPFWVQSALAWGLFLPLGWLLGVYMGGGVGQAWYGGLVYVSILALVLHRRFRSGAWREIEI